MKKITEDLEITAIVISQKQRQSIKRAEVHFKFLGQFHAKALYYENSTSYSWFETDGEAAKIHESFSEKVEDNEDAIIEFVNKQIEKEYA